MKRCMYIYIVHTYSQVVWHLNCPTKYGHGIHFGFVKIYMSSRLWKNVLVVFGANGRKLEVTLCEYCDGVDE